MRDNDLIARLAAVNPVTPGTLVAEPLRDRLRPPVEALPTGARQRVGRRRVLVLALAAGAIAVPLAAFAAQLGELLGLSNEGTPVATSELSVYRDTKLAEAIRELQWPGQMRLLGERDGIGFYATRKDNGEFCFAMDTREGSPGFELVACTPPGFFPSPEHPIIGVPVGDVLRSGTLAGFAADGVAQVDALDATGATIASADVRDNIYAATGVPEATVTAIVARGADGAVLFRKTP